MLKIIAIALSILGATVAYPTGAPEEICDSMIPGHGVEPQSSRFDYKVTPSEQVVKADQKVVIEINGQRPFKGFLIEVRDGDRAVGKFNIQDDDADAKPLNCHSGTATAATHKHPESKQSIRLQWIAPEEKKTYQIYVTIVETYEIFWARQNVGSIKVE